MAPKFLYKAHRQTMSNICMQKGIPCDQCPSCCWLWLEVCIYIIYIYFVTAANYQKSCKCYCTSINMIIYMFIKTNVWTILCILSIFRFTNAVCKFPGSTHDAYILQNSEIQYVIMGLRDGGWILGDSGYPLKEWLMTPINNPRNRQEENYNRAHCRTRNVVERAFGVLKARFRYSICNIPVHFHHINLKVFF